MIINVPAESMLRNDGVGNLQSDENIVNVRDTVRHGDVKRKFAKRELFQFVVTLLFDELYGVLWARIVQY